MQQAHGSAAETAVRFENWGLYNLSRDGLPNLGLVSLKNVKMVDWLRSFLWCLLSCPWTGWVIPLAAGGGGAASGTQKPIKPFP